MKRQIAIQRIVANIAAEMTAGNLTEADIEFLPPEWMGYLATALDQAQKVAAAPPRALEPAPGGAPIEHGADVARGGLRVMEFAMQVVGRQKELPDVESFGLYDDLTRIMNSMTYRHGLLARLMMRRPIDQATLQDQTQPILADLMALCCLFSHALTLPIEAALQRWLRQPEEYLSHHFTHTNVESQEG